MPWITDDELAIALSATLGLAGITELADLEADYQEIVPMENRHAYGDIIAILKRRGFTVAQLGAWVEKDIYNSWIGQYFAIIRGNGLEGIPVGSQATWGYLDLRKDLETLTLLDGDDNPIEPDNTSSSIGFGRLNTALDFNVPNLADPRRGGPTRW
jgi:hypothetical protein